MQTSSPLQSVKLIEAILEILEQEKDGISEHALIKRLQQDRDSFFSTANFANSWSLFNVHFVLFHNLYALREHLLAEQRSLLTISALNIALSPFNTGEDALDRHDPLVAYYTDYRNLENTSAESLEAMISRFWSSMLLPEEKTRALKTLALPSDAGYTEVKKQFRKMVMAHHPDRGGDAEKMGEINEAMRVLKQHYQRSKTR